MKKYESRYIERSILFELDNWDLITLLASRFPELKEVKPNEVNLWIDVPTGGDYSGCRLDIDKDFPLKIRVINKVKE